MEYLFHFWIFFLNIHGYLLKYSIELLLNMEYSFPFRDILKDIHQINSGYPGYLHEYSFLILNISLVILNNHMNIHFWFWISLLEKEYSCLFLDIPDAPDPSLPCGRPDCFAMLPISHLSQVQPTCSPSQSKTCRGSQTFNPHPHHSTFIQVFVKLPCPCQVRCPGNPERGFMKKLINTHTLILQKHEELLARRAIDKKFYTW